MPSAGQPILIQAAPDARILVFTLGLTVLTAVLFGLLPALRASRPDPWTTLKDTVGSVAGGTGSLFLRKGLVAAQVALSFLLLFGAGLFVQSLQNLKTTETGVALDNLVTFQLAPALSGYDVERTVEFLPGPARAPSRGAGCHIRGAGVGADPERRRMGQHHAGRRAQARDGEDMQAYMNSLSPGLLRHDADPLPRRTRLQPDGHQADRHRRDRQPPVRRALLPREERDRPPPRTGLRPRRRR